MWQTHVSICRCLSQTLQLLQVLQVNECFQCVALSVAVEYSLRHLRYCCISSTICKRREIIDSACDVVCYHLWTNSEIMKCEQSRRPILSLACVICVIGLMFFILRTYMCWISPVHQASCSYHCDQTKSEVVKPSLAELEPNPNCEAGRTEPNPNWESPELEPNPNYNNDRTEQNPNLHCWLRFPSLVKILYSPGYSTVKYNLNPNRLN